jgi:hypothetical protein
MGRCELRPTQTQWQPSWFNLHSDMMRSIDATLVFHRHISRPTRHSVCYCHARSLAIRPPLFAVRRSSRV